MLGGIGNDRLFGPTAAGQGLYKSTDGGNSWVQMGSGFPSGNNGNINFIGTDINGVIVDPANSGTVYLASAAGVAVSYDGGLNWPVQTNLGDTRSIELDTSTPPASRVLYAGVAQQGVYRSNDGGATWTQILLPTTLAVANAVGPALNGFGKVIVALAPPASPPNANGVQVLYVSMAGTGNAPDPVGVFISTDQGATWSQQTATSLPPNTQGGYSFDMAVDPASPGDGVNDIIYFGTRSEVKSTNSGVSFAKLTDLADHGDNHAWAFVPQPSPAPSIVYCGGDQGIDVSTDGGTTWSTLGGNGLQTGLVYNIDLKPDATASVVVAALQDTGLMTTALQASPAWLSPQGADGFDIAYDGVTPDRVYATSGFWATPPIHVFLSNVDGTDIPQPAAAGAQDITPWGTTSDQAGTLFPVATDPSNAGHVYVSGNQNLWQTRNAGTIWRKIGSFSNPGDVDVAPSNGQNVVIAVGNQVYVTTNALAASGVTFTNITRNLPGRNVARARFDPIDPTVIYAVLGGFSKGGPPGHVFRTTIGGTSWTDITPAAGTPATPLDLPCNAIALDGTDVPTTIYLGTDLGVLRSVDGGASWTVLDDIHLPRVPVTDLVINTQAGVLCAGTYGRGVFMFVYPTGPSIAVRLQDDLAFGTVCGGPVYLTITVYNVGQAPLTVSSVQVLLGSSDFSVLPTPATPLVVAVGEEVTFTVAYTPTVAGTQETAIIRITCNDPAAPYVDVAATGTQGTATLAAAIAPEFPDTCVGAAIDELLTIDNSGTCALLITDISSSSPDFLLPGVVSFPLLLAPGSSLDLALRFQPTAFGAASGTITIVSNDPASPLELAVAGQAPAPKLALVIADQGSFGDCCVGSFRDEPLVLNNSGACTLTITSITSSSPEFLAPEVSSYPLTIKAGSAVEVPIRLAPTSFGAKAATITVVSDDPASPHTISLSGHAPSGTLAVTGLAYFGGVRCGRREFRTIAVCNVGDCDLHVSGVAFKHRSKHWRLVHNPFPATLHRGSSLDVTIRYTALQAEPRPCQILISSDDPTCPVREIDVIAWTCCCCRECCEDCRERRPCEARHKEHCEDHHRGCCHEERSHEPRRRPDDDC